MSKDFDRSRLKDTVQIIYHSVATLGAIAALILAAPTVLANLSAIATLLFTGEDGCFRAIALMIFVEASIAYATVKIRRARLNSAMKIASVILPLLAVFVVSDICPRLGLAILEAVGCV